MSCFTSQGINKINDSLYWVWPIYTLTLSQYVIDIYYFRQQYYNFICALCFLWGQLLNKDDAHFELESSNALEIAPAII